MMSSPSPVRPSREQLAELGFKDRLIFRFSHFCNTVLKAVLIHWNRSFGISLIGACTGRRLQIQGIEHIREIPSNARVLLVANHRSLFDFYVVSWVTFRLTGMGRRCFFPVRSNFFYDSLAGMFINLIVAGQTMFPPIMRESRKRTFNRFSMEFLKRELSVPGTIVGIHPEGTRNKSADPYSFLSAKPGAGELALLDPDLIVIPIFVLGLSNAIHQEFADNWLRPDSTPIDIVFGARIGFEDLRVEGNPVSSQAAATERCMDAIRDLASVQQGIAAGRQAPSSAKPADPLLT
jgi:1-acyl-sn-glycerol-3-phosphate acyltransferase